MVELDITEKMQTATDWFNSAVFIVKANQLQVFLSIMRPIKVLDSSANPSHETSANC